MLQEPSKVPNEKSYFYITCKNKTFHLFVLTVVKVTTIWLSFAQDHAPHQCRTVQQDLRQYLIWPHYTGLGSVDDEVKQKHCSRMWCFSR